MKRGLIFVLVLILFSVMVYGQECTNPIYVSLAGHAAFTPNPYSLQQYTMVCPPDGNFKIYIAKNMAGFADGHLGTAEGVEGYVNFADFYIDKSYNCATTKVRNDWEPVLYMLSDPGHVSTDPTKYPTGDKVIYCGPPEAQPECTTDINCASNVNGKFCVGQKCVACKVNTDCSAGNICTNNVCVPQQGECSINADCQNAAKPICNLAIHICEEEDCSLNGCFNPALPVCNMGTKKCESSVLDPNCGTCKNGLSCSVLNGGVDCGLFCNSPFICPNSLTCVDNLCRQSCTKNSDCPTVASSCVDGMCSIRKTCTTNADCGGYLCDIFCVAYCTDDAFCDTASGYKCDTVSQTCKKPETCVNDNACASVTGKPWCDVQTSKCVQCLNTNQCDSLSVCVSGSCIVPFCSNDNSCVNYPEKPKCINGVCSAVTTPQGGCTITAECTAPNICVNQKCVECGNNADCKDATKTLCNILGNCVECKINTDCKDPLKNKCNAQTFVCEQETVEIGCTLDSECTVPGEKCVSGVCTAGTPKGNLNPTGATCTKDTDCVNYPYAVCQDDICYNIGDGQGTVGCTSDAQCGANEVCDNGVCKAFDYSQTCSNLGGITCKDSEECTGKEVPTFSTENCCVPLDIQTASSAVCYSNQFVPSVGSTMFVIKGLCKNGKRTIKYCTDQNSNGCLADKQTTEDCAEVTTKGSTAEVSGFSFAAALVSLLVVLVFYAFRLKTRKKNK